MGKELILKPNKWSHDDLISFYNDDTTSWLSSKFNEIDLHGFAWFDIKTENGDAKVKFQFFADADNNYYTIGEIDESINS